MTVGIMPNAEFAEMSDVVLWEVLVWLPDTLDIWYNVAGIIPIQQLFQAKKGGRAITRIQT